MRKAPRSGFGLEVLVAMQRRAPWGGGHSSTHRLYAHRGQNVSVALWSVYPAMVSREKRIRWRQPAHEWETKWAARATKNAYRAYLGVPDMVVEVSVNNFVALRTVKYMPQAAGMPTMTQAR